jgi:hypothetical protein
MEIIDRRGGKNPKPTEACRVCGSKEVHTREYNQPTKECMQYMLAEIRRLEKKNNMNRFRRFFRKYFFYSFEKPKMFNVRNLRSEIVFLER